MPLNYINSPETDFSRGIDARSAENQIQPGFVADLLNADIVERRARKRPGYQGYAGNLPVRVLSFEQVDATNQVCFNLDASIDLGSQRSTPIVVYGRSSSIASGGPFTTAGDTLKYYSGFTLPTRKTMVAASTLQSLVVPESEHGIASTNMYAAVAEATSTVDRSYQTALPHDISIDGSSDGITVQYENNTGTDKSVYVYYKDRQAVGGSVYIATLSHTGSGSESFTITAGTHGLANFNIVAQIQEDRTTAVGIVEPDSFTISASGTVTVTLTNDTATTYYVILSAAAVTATTNGNVEALSTGTVTLSSLTSPWVFYSVYLQSTAGGDLELVSADTIDYDDSTATATLTFTNRAPEARNFVVYYLYGSTKSNQLCVTDASVTSDASDGSPQLTIWGLDHKAIYGDSAAVRAGWVTHVDSYRSASEQRLVSGLGGNLFAAKSYSEAGTAYGYASLLPNAQARTASAGILGPLLYDTLDTPARTRGYITADSSGTNWATVTGVSYDSGNGWTKYTLSLPSKAILDASGVPTTLGAVLSTTASLEDWLTVEDMGYSRFNGTFKIRQAQDGTDEIFVWVENDQVTSSDWDDANCSGQAGVFTDQLTWSVTSPFIPGDTLSSAGLNSSFICTVKSSHDAVSVIDGLSDPISLASGLLTAATRTSDVMPLRDRTTASVADVVAGDMMSYTTTDAMWDGRLLRVLYINPDSSRPISISGDGTTATATLGSGNTAYLAEGRKVLLTNAGVYTGPITVSSIVSDTVFTFTSSETDTVTGGTLLGSTIQLDESFTWADTIDQSTGVTVEARWIPIEAPDDSYDLTPSTHRSYFSSFGYDLQDFIRSTMVVNNMYLTNYQDEVLKFDGTNNYRAGLFSWQPGLFITQDTSATAKVVLNLKTVAFSAISANGGYVTISSADQLVLTVNTNVRLSGSSSTYTITSIQTDPNDSTLAYLYMDRKLDGSVSSTGTVAEIAVRRYYFRLNAVDANNNIVASAVTGYQDHVVELAADAAVYIKGVGMPAWGVYDYDRLEVEIYGTKTNTSAPFYRLTTIQMDFDNTQGYFQYTDSLADTDLIDLDTVNTALKGQELGTAWQEPLRAKYVTSIANTLVLGNVRDYPQLDLQLVASGAVADATYAGKIFTFRKDNTDTGTTTSMPDRARYELVQTSGATSVSSAAGTAGTSFTVTVANSAAAGDWVYLFWAAVATSGQPLKYAGWWQIASATGTDITINYADSDSGDISADTPDSALFATDPTDIPVPLGADGNLGMVNGDSFDTFDVGRRLSMAINASMRMVDISVTGMENFVPWMTARGGNDTGRTGRILIRQPKVLSTFLELQLPASFSGSGQSFQVFVNDIRRSPSDQVSAAARLYPSRILVSYENYPEVFDNPTAILDTESDSAIDVNSADGQEITGILPFFGEAAFTAAQQTSVLIVFKTNSIYLVDVNQKRLGNQAVQRIETEGLGCTAPYSIAVTKNGIIFANQSGIYCLRRNQAIEYLGRYMERNWTERVNLEQLAIAQGHHYGVGRLYKLSVPLVGDTAASEAYVYNHTEEDLQGKQGSWGRYDNHPATGWANLSTEAYFGAVTGRVFKLRNLNTVSDYRDDNEAITFRLDTRPLDFGNSGIRKVVDRAIINYRVGARSENTKVLFSADTTEEFRDSTDFIIPRRVTSSGIDDQPNRRIYQIDHDTDRRRGTYFQVRVENAGMDEGIEVAGMDFRVGGLSAKGIVKAKQTQSK